MLSEVVYNPNIGSPTASLPPTVSGSLVSPSEFGINNLNDHLNHINLSKFPPTSCSAAVLMASADSSTSSTPAPADDQTHAHNPGIGTTGPSMSLPSSAAASSAGAVLLSLGKPKRSKLRPRLSLRIALSSSQQASGSSPMSPSNGFPGCSFDGCLPLSPSVQKQLLQKSEPLLSASALDEPQPVEILPKLYIGTMKSASDRTLLERLGIGYIINVTTNLPNFFEERYPNSFKYYRIPLEDHWSGEISQYVDEAIAFINTARHSDRACLVHCLAGRSRSVAIVLAYIMHTFACSLDDAYDLVKNRKPGVAPGLHFLRQLNDLEKNTVVKNNPCDATNSPYSSSSGGVGSEESSGCSTPSSMSMSSFDPVDPSSSTASLSGPQLLPTHLVTRSENVQNPDVRMNEHVVGRDRTACPSVPSVDSAFTDDQTPPAPTSSQSFSVFSGNDTLTG